MYIEELKGGGVDHGKEEEQLSGSGAFRVGFVAEDARRALVGAGTQALFYPTLLYNVFRNKVQAEFRWWDRVDEVKSMLLLLLSFFCFRFFFVLDSLFGFLFQSMWVFLLVINFDHVDF